MTQLYIKTKDMPWPKDSFFYLLAQDGLYKCRNHQFYQSAIKVQTWDREREDQDEFCVPNYPRVPQHLMELTVGFFKAIADKYNTEAIVLLVYNTQTQQVELVCPEQWSVVWKGYDNKYSGGYNIHYQPPKDLPFHLVTIGSIHSHVDIGPGHSGIDDNDEANRPSGLHIIIGHVRQAKPSIACQVVVDGERFNMKTEAAIEGYGFRDDNVPVEWFGKFSLRYSEFKPEKKRNRKWFSGFGTFAHHGHDD